MTIGMIGAMEEEVEGLAEKLEEKQEEVCAGMRFLTGKIEGKGVALVCSGIGKVNAAVAASILMERFHADCILNTGIAGGIAPEVKLGDIVLSTDCLEHDFDVTAFGYVWGQVPQLPAVFVSDDLLVGKAKQAAEVFEGAAVEQGLIVSGDRFVHSSEGVAEIRSHFPEVKAVEMEAAAIAQACHQLNTPFVVIRAMSDSADEKADISFEEFLKTAAASSAKMVEKIVASL